MIIVVYISTYVLISVIKVDELRERRGRTVGERFQGLPVERKGSDGLDI